MAIRGEVPVAAIELLARTDTIAGLLQYADLCITQVRRTNENTRQHTKKTHEESFGAHYGTQMPTDASRKYNTTNKRQRTGTLEEALFGTFGTVCPIMHNTKSNKPEHTRQRLEGTSSPPRINGSSNDIIARLEKKYIYMCNGVKPDKHESRVSTAAL